MDVGRIKTHAKQSLLRRPCNFYTIQSRNFGLLGEFGVKNLLGAQRSTIWATERAKQLSTSKNVLIYMQSTFAIYTVPSLHIYEQLPRR